MKNKTAIFTIVSKNYLALARTLMASVKQFYPNNPLYVCLADKIDGYFDPANESFKVIEAHQLDIANFKNFAFRYEIIEFNTAVKPYMFEWLFENTDCQSAIYLDPDILLLGKLDHIENYLAEGATAVLTPHICEPITDRLQPNEIDMLKAGLYNLGFIAINKVEEGENLIHWWSKHCEKNCTINLEEGIFVDQKWMDLVPCIFKNIKILKNPGYNTAYWNLFQRQIEKDGDAWLAKGEPLRFFHFSGIDLKNPKIFSKHQNRFSISNIGKLKDLYSEYIDRVKKNHFDECIQWPYAYGEFISGEKISSAMRAIFRDTLDQNFIKTSDPFSIDVNFFNEPSPDIQRNDRPLITRLMYQIWKDRKDLRKAFDLSRLSDQNKFIGWFLNSAEKELKLEKTFIAPCPLKKENDLSSLEPTYENPKTSLIQRSFGSLYSKINQWSLQNYKRFSFFYRRLSPEFRSKIKTYFFRNAFDLDQKTSLSPNKENLRPIGCETQDIKKGVNLIGYARAEIGMGEHVRLVAKSFSEMETSFIIWDLPCEEISQRDNQFEKYISKNNPYSVNLFNVNADSIQYAISKLGTENVNNRYNIGYWAWELSQFPKEWLEPLNLLDEIWSPSTFIQNSISPLSKKPVLHMPLAVDFKYPQFDRKHFNLPENKFLFLFFFDFGSFIARKNPNACIEAFKRAFPEKNAPVGIVIKTMRKETDLSGYNELLQKIKGDPRIIFLDTVLMPNEVKGLVNVCDSFISLHRSEGFGRGLAEAMLLGKPTIGTNYSGNTDFMDQTNSCLVDYELIPVRENEYPFGKNQVWANPDIDHASWHMKKIFKDESFRKLIGMKARDHIQLNHNSKTIGERYLSRLKFLELA